MKNYKLEDLVGEVILTIFENEARVEKSEDGYKIIMLAPSKPMEPIYFPKVYPESDIDQPGKEIEIYCEII